MHMIVPEGITIIIVACKIENAAEKIKNILRILECAGMDVRQTRIGIGNKYVFFFICDAKNKFQD